MADWNVTGAAQVIRHATAGGAPLGSSGLARLKIYNQPAGDSGYALIEAGHPAGQPRIRDHVHLRHEETFLVLAGEYQVRLGSQIIVVAAGDYVFVPRGTPHTYRNVGPRPSRMLNIMSPADGVELLIELGALATETVTDSVVSELHARHGAELAQPLPDW